MAARRDGGSQGARTRGENDGWGLLGGQAAMGLRNGLMREEMQVEGRAGDAGRGIEDEGRAGREEEKPEQQSGVDAARSRDRARCGCCRLVVAGARRAVKMRLLGGLMMEPVLTEVPEARQTVEQSWECSFQC